jgi:GNAT superfamily N-acetyltransferase
MQRSMSVVERNLPAKMVRVSLDSVPEFALPAGFSLRWYQPGDEENWRQIHLAADCYNKITPELFQHQFGTDERLLRDRQCYLLDPRSEVIGTGTAWFNDNFEGVRFGRVHWMAIVPEFQGRGLAKSLMTVICRRLRELGHDRAYLSTSSARRPAINLYLRFGFVPLLRSEKETAVWRTLSRRLLRGGKKDTGQPGKC